MRRGGSIPVVMILVAACGSPAVTPSPSIPNATPRATVGPTATSAATPLATPTATPAPPLTIGSYAVTVADRLRVRSAPRVSDDSIRHVPVLPLGTELRIVGGPVTASGYVWWRIEPVSFVLESVTSGWVAAGDHDGTPWISATDGPAMQLAIADVPRAPADPALARPAAAAVDAFGLDLYRELLSSGVIDPAQNAVMSPASIALALGMARAGARGETASEMDAVLHVDGWDRLGPGLGALEATLSSRNHSWKDSEDRREVALRIANAAFGPEDWTLEPAFLDAIASSFGSGLNLVDYISDPDAARRAINAWVDGRTGGRIPELLTPPDVTSATRIYLVNAIYLKAEWEERFQEGGTEPGVFTRLDGTRVEVPMMRRFSGGLGPPTVYVRGDGWQATELRYLAAPDEPQLAMTLILPKDLPAFEAAFSPTRLEEIVRALVKERARFGVNQCPEVPDAGCYPYDLELAMPRFEVDTRLSLNGPLAGIGMPSAFDPSVADFTGINRTDALFISNVIHQANIDVDEKGTEAAAATAVGVDTGGGPSPMDKITLRLDRPFLFALRDLETGAILFLGRVVDPSSGR